jgi:hypothetical protein
LQEEEFYVPTNQQVDVFVVVVFNVHALEDQVVLQVVRIHSPRYKVLKMRINQGENNREAHLTRFQLIQSFGDSVLTLP